MLLVIGFSLLETIWLVKKFIKIYDLKLNLYLTQKNFFLGEPLTASEYAQDLIKGELTQRLFGVTQKIHKKLPPETGLEEGEESVFPR